jgi:hypothetical protein
MLSESGSDVNIVSKLLVAPPSATPQIGDESPGAHNLPVAQRAGIPLSKPA